MRKLISLLLALVMVMSFATVAFAYEGSANAAATIQKSYEIKHGTSANTEFSFKIAFDKYENNEGVVTTITNAPELTVAATQNLANKEAATLTEDLSIDLSAFAKMPIGIYYYNITEIIPADGAKIAGVTYDETPYLRLKVTVYHDAEGKGINYVGAIRVTDTDNVKTNIIENSYDAGALTVTKYIKGNMADMEKEFTFTIVLTAPTGTVFTENQNANDNEGAEVEKTSASEWKITVNLGNEESINITNIPAGTTYTVTEKNDGYTESSEFSDTSKTIAGGDEDTAKFTNTKSSDVDTGISLDSIPFVVMMVVCAAAAVLFIIKRRSVEF